MTLLDIGDGVSLSVRVLGKPSNKHVVLIASGSIFNFKQFDPVLLPRLRQYLGPGYTFINYDYTGIGESSGLIGDFDFLQLMEQQKQLLDRLGFEKVHLLGYSKGSLINFLMTAKYPDMVMSIAGYGNPNLADPTSSLVTRSEFGSRVEALNTISDSWDSPIDHENFDLVYNKVFLPTIFDQQYEGALSRKQRLFNWWVKRQLYPMLEGTMIRNLVKLYRYYMGQPTSEDAQRYKDVMKKISCPCLLMHGGRDEIIPWSSSKLLAEWIPGAELQIFQGFKHANPVLIPWQGRKIMASYAKFLRNLDMN